MTITVRIQSEYWGCFNKSADAAQWIVNPTRWTVVPFTFSKYPLCCLTYGIVSDCLRFLALIIYTKYVHSVILRFYCIYEINTVHWKVLKNIVCQATVYYICKLLSDLLKQGYRLLYIPTYKLTPISDITGWCFLWFAS